MYKLLVAFLLGATSVAAQCGNGTFINGFCACPSNHFPVQGLNCEGVGTCENIADALPLESDIVGTLESHEIVDGELMLEVYSPMRNGRIVTSLNLNGGCAYPGEHWTKTTDVCFDVYTSDLSYEDVFDCIVLDQDSVGDEYLRFTSHLAMSVVDRIGELRGIPATRTTTSAIGLEFLIRNYVNVTVSDVLVTAPFDVEVVLIEQTLTPSLPPSLKLRFRSSTIYPYEIGAGSFKQAARDLDLSLTPFGDVCDSQSEDPCVQEWEVEFGPPTRGDPQQDCDLSGSYELILVGSCRLDQGCPKGSVGNSSFVVGINEANLCTNVQITAEASGSLASYGDSGFADPKSAFIQDQRAFFLLSVTADLPISNIIPSSITVVHAGNGKLLVSEQLATTIGTDASVELGSFETQQGGGGTTFFSFNLNVGKTGSNTLFELDDTSEVFEFDVIVVATVQYVGQFRRSTTEQVEMVFRQRVTGVRRGFSGFSEGDASVIAPLAPVVLCGAAAIAQANF